MSLRRTSGFGARVSMEDADTEITEVPVAMSPEEAIQAEEEAAEFDAVADAAEKDIEGLEEAEGAQDDLEAVVVEGEEKLEKPEEVTAQDAAVATEALKVTAAMLGVSLDDYGVSCVSYESADKSPLDSLKVSLEGAKEFAAKLAEQAKELFQRVMAAIKKLAAQVVVLLSRTGSLAKGLAEKVAKMKEPVADAKFDEKESLAIANKIFVIAALGNGTISAKPESEFKFVFDSIASTKEFDDQVKMLDAYEKDIAAKVDGKSSEELVKTISAMFENKIGVSPLAEKVADYVDKNSSDFTGIPKEAGVSSIARFDGASFKGYSVLKDLSLVTFKVAAKPDVLKKVKVEVPSKEAVLNILKQIVVSAEGTKKVSDAALKFIDKNNAFIKKLGDILTKDDELSKNKALALKVGNRIARKLVTSTTFDAIFGLVGFNKAALSYCAMASKKLGKAE